MNSRSAIWLIVTLCVFTVLLTVLFSCEAGMDPDTDTPNDTVYYPADTDRSDTSDTQNTAPNTSYTDSTDTAFDTSDDTFISDSDTETETETETTAAEPETAPLSIGIKGDFIPSDASVDALYAAIEDFGSPVSIKATDINTGVSIFYNADARLAPASIIKASVVLYACREIDAGRASLDEKLTYTSADLVHGNGAIGKKGIGTKFTLRDVIYHTVKTSDNEGYYMLLRRFSRSGHDDMIRSLGCTSGLVRSSRWPKVTANDFARVWQEIYDYRNESTTGKWLYELFLTVDRMHFIRDALGLETANKAGWNATSFNDTAIVYGDRTYILVVLTDGSYYNADKDAYAYIVRAVNMMMSEYALVADPMPETNRFEDDLPEPLPYTPPETTAPPVTDTEPPVTETTPPPTTEPVTDTTADTTAPDTTDAVTEETTGPEEETTGPEEETTGPAEDTTAPIETETFPETESDTYPETETDTEIPNE